MLHVSEPLVYGQAKIIIEIPHAGVQSPDMSDPPDGVGGEELVGAGSDLAPGTLWNAE